MLLEWILILLVFLNETEPKKNVMKKYLLVHKCLLKKKTKKEQPTKYYKEPEQEVLPDNLKDIGVWDVSGVTNMFHLFEECNYFNEDISGWNVSNVINMAHMFENCTKFNQDLSGWNVSKVTNMENMFRNCENFNKPLNTNPELNSWNVSNVENMSRMFENCTKFNQDLNGWNVSNVKNMNGMFNNCTQFNSPLNLWNVSNVIDMVSMFDDCTTFNQNISNWRLDSIPDFDETYLESMFENCPINLEFKPRRRRGVVDATQIHKASANIDYEKLKQFLIDQILATEGKQMININRIMSLSQNKNANQLKQNLLDLFGKLNETIERIEKQTKIYLKNNEKKYFEKLNSFKKLKFDLEKILNKLKLVDNFGEYKPNLFIPCIFLTLFYVECKAPIKFKIIYLQTYLYDNLHAYDGIAPSETMSCVKGILERVFMSLIPAFTTCYPDSESLQTLTNILHNNIKTTLPEYILEWYALHNIYKPDHFSDDDYTNTEFMENNLKEYLENKFPSRSDKDNEFINETVKENTQHIGYDKSAFLSGLEPIIYDFISKYPKDSDSFNLRKYLIHKFPKEDYIDEEVGPNLKQRINMQIAEYEMKTAKEADNKALSQEYDLSRYLPDRLDKTEGKGPTKMEMGNGGTRRRNIRRKTRKNV